MPKTAFLQIRISPEDKRRIERAAAAEYLDASTWARSVILKAVEEWEREMGNELGKQDGSGSQI